MARTIRDYAGSNASGDLSPLFANDSYTKAANAELARLDAAEAAAAASLVADDDYRGTVTMFGNACASLRAIAKKFPETGKFINEAIKQTQLAMSGVVNNPVAAPATPASVPSAPAGKPLTDAENARNQELIRQAKANRR